MIVRHSNNSAQIVDDGNDLKENIPMFEDVQLSETFKNTSTYASEQYSDNSVQTVDTVKDHQGNGPIFEEIILPKTFETRSTDGIELYSDDFVQIASIVKDHQEYSPMFEDRLLDVIGRNSYNFIENVGLKYNNQKLFSSFNTSKY